MENVSNAAISTPVDSTSQGVSEVSSTPETSTEPKLDTKSVKEESFKEWKARTEAEKASKASKEAAAPKPTVPATPDLASIKESLTPDKTNIKDSLSADKNALEPNKVSATTLKVGDREYKPEDITKLSKDTEQFKAQSAHFESENKKMIAQVESHIKELQTDPGKVLDRFKISQEQIEKYYYEKYLKPQLETPVEKATRLEKELNERNMADENKIKQTNEEQQRAQNRTYWEGEIKKGLTSANLPENSWTIQRTAGYIAQNQQKNLNLPMEKIMEVVKQDYAAAQQESLKGMSPEQIRSALGEEALKKIRSEEVAKYKNDKFKNENPSQGTVKRENNEKKKYRSAYDLLDDL